MTTTFGTVLRDVLAAHRLSQSRAAEMADYDHSYVSRLVAGSRMPTRDFVIRISEGCDFSRQDYERLLVAAGFIPLGRDSALLDPELQEAAEALNDPAIPQPYREFLRRQISALVGITRQMAEAA